MLGAVPYFILRPAVDMIVAREFTARQARGDTSAVYNDPRAARQEFYRRARANGWDVRFGDEVSTTAEPTEVELDTLRALQAA